MRTFFNRLKNILKNTTGNEAGTTNDNFYRKNPNASLTSRELFGISLGLIIAEQNGAYINSLEVGETNFPQKQMMERNWNIYGREDAIEFLDARSSEGHRKHFNKLLEVYVSQGENKDKKGLGILYNLEEVYKLERAREWFGEKENLLHIETDAWDFGRIVFVARVCYTLGYISDTEAWEYIERMIKLATERYTNWEDYAKSYVLGRAMWNGNDGEWQNVVAFASDALVAKESPWLTLKWQ